MWPGSLFGSTVKACKFQEVILKLGSHGVVIFAIYGLKVLFTGNTSNSRHAYTYATLPVNSSRPRRY